MIQKGYSKNVGTRWLPYSDVNRINSEVRQYLEKNNWYELKESIPTISFGNEAGVSLYLTRQNNRHHGQTRGPISHNLGVQISGVPTKQNLVDKIFFEITNLNEEFSREK